MDKVREEHRKETTGRGRERDEQSSLCHTLPLTFGSSIAKLFVRFPQLLSGLESCFVWFVTTLGFFVLSPPRSKEFSGKENDHASFAFFLF